MSESLQVTIVGGPNGAGKTTSSRTLLSDVFGTTVFVNADHIAQGLAGFATETVAFEAGRLMLQRLEELFTARQDFALESTLASRSLASHVRIWKAAGYRFNLYYFWLNRPELAVARVAQRVAQNGHHVPDETVRRRYGRSIANLLKVYIPLADVWRVYDNSSVGHSIPVVEGRLNTVETVFQPGTWRQLQEGSA